MLEKHLPKVSLFFSVASLLMLPLSRRWFHAMGMPNTTILPARFHLALVGLEVEDLPTDWRKKSNRLEKGLPHLKLENYNWWRSSVDTFLVSDKLHFSFPKKSSGLIGVGLGSSSSCLVPRWQIWGGTHDKWFYAPNLKMALRKNGYKVRFATEMPNKSLNMFWTISLCPIKR